MIPRYQVILFSVLVLASVAMGVVLWQLQERAHKRMLAGEDSAPTKAPEVASAEQATLLVANDEDNSLLSQVQSLPLPSDPGARARAVLGRLLDLYASPNSTHPVPGGASSVLQVFLLPAPDVAAGPAIAASSSAPVNASSPATTPAPDDPNSPQLAVVNLTGNFAASHPAGLEAETLTVLSICGTLHANLPRVTEVRFLVDGEPRASLAGHADLTRTYFASDTAPADLTHP